MKTSLTKVKQKTGLLIVNFGGPRDLNEIPSFLTSLLCDKDVVRTSLPYPLHRYLFTRIAKKRSKKVALDYQSIGGKSPIYDDTESVAKKLREILPLEIHTFHRYLPQTHSQFIRTLLISEVEKWIIFPMFPQFSYTTSGSIARWFDQKLPKDLTRKMCWIKSYPHQKPFIDLFSQRIRRFLESHQLVEKEVLLFFSAHGLPKKFVLEGDPYQQECELSYQLIVENFKESAHLLAYQSKFGPGEWLRPYTIDACNQIDDVIQDKKHVIFIPLAFTSDHIETLFEIETEYMPIIKNKGLNVYRLSAFNNEPDWVAAIEDLLEIPHTLVYNQMLIRPSI